MAGYAQPALPAEWIGEQIKDITRRIQAANLPCVWIGPGWGTEGGPYFKNYARVRQVNAYLESNVAPCRYIDSTKFRPARRVAHLRRAALHPAGLSEMGPGDRPGNRGARPGEIGQASRETIPTFSPGSPPVIFASFEFLFLFLPIFFVVYYLTPVRLRNWPILILSWAFYAWWRVDFLALLVCVTRIHLPDLAHDGERGAGQPGGQALAAGRAGGQSRRARLLQIRQFRHQLAERRAGGRQFRPDPLGGDRACRPGCRSTCCNRSATWWTFGAAPSRSAGRC